MASALSNRQNCTCARKTLQTQQGRTHGAGCVRQWFRTAEPLGERRYENWNTHTFGDELTFHRMGLRVSVSAHVTNGGSGGMMSTAGLELPYPRGSKAKFRDETSRKGK